MNKLIFLSLILVAFCINNSIAQSVNKWSIGLNATPERYIGTVTLSSINYPQQPFELSSSLNYSFGTTVNYHLNDQLVLTSGINYSNKDHGCGSAPCIVITDEQGYLIDDSEASYTLRYLEVPLGIQYQFLNNEANKQAGLLLELGVSTGFLVSDEVLNDTKFNLGAYAGVGLQWQISHLLSLQTLLHYKVTALVEQLNTDRIFNLVGLRTALAYHF